MGWHIFWSMTLAGLTFYGCQVAGLSSAACLGLAALVFVLYWLGWVVFIGDVDLGDWF